MTTSTVSISILPDHHRLEARKKIALVAHDNEKKHLLSWVMKNREKLVPHELYATGTTGKMLQEKADLAVTALQSGPLGGDLQIGALITEGKIDFLVFFWDPLEAQPHDPDVKAVFAFTLTCSSQRLIFWSIF